MAVEQLGPSAAALAQFEKTFAKSFGDAVLRRVDDTVRYDVIPTGSLELDLAMGAGGYVRGRLTELYGPTGSGKTTMTLLAAAEAQHAYPEEMVGFIDMEHTFDADWAECHGVDLQRLYLVQPQDSEEVADVLKQMTEAGFFSVIILDSIGAMIPKEEMEKNAGDVSVGTAAKIITRMVKISTVQAHKFNVAILLINQIRAVIGGPPMGAKTGRGGGFALTHVTTHVLKFRKSDAAITVGTDDAKTEIGQEIAVQVEKNKIAPAKKTARITLMHRETSKFGPIGVDRAREAAILAKKLALVPISGSYYQFRDERVSSKEAAIDYLRKHPGEVASIRQAVLATVADTLVQDDLDEG
jgi:recombination protein RecA